MKQKTEIPQRKKKNNNKTFIKKKSIQPISSQLDCWRKEGGGREGREQREGEEELEWEVNDTNSQHQDATSLQTLQTCKE